MVARLVVIVVWAVVAFLAGGALYGLVETLATRLRRRRGMATTALTEVQRQRLGCAGCLPLLLVIVLGVLGRLPGTGVAENLAPAILRALLLMVGLAFLGLCLTPAIVLGVWRARSPQSFVEGGSVVSLVLLATALAGAVLGGVVGLVFGLILGLLL